MNTLRIELKQDSAHFLPRQLIEGTAGWALSEAPKKMAIRLFWYTSGKGDRDIGIADQLEFEAPPADFLTDFQFKAPNHPCSFDGKLISIQWAVELVAEPSGNTDRIELTIGPEGHAITPQT